MSINTCPLKVKLQEKPNPEKIEKMHKDLHQKPEPWKVFSLTELCFNHWIVWKNTKYRMQKYETQDAINLDKAANGDGVDGPKLLG